MAWKRSIPTLRVRLAASICCVVSISGCIGGVVGGSPLMERLNGRGPVLLASDNPYLPANRLLQDELADSDTMREFVDRRGSPAALGVTRGILARPEIHLYYPEQGEVYSFKRRSGDWQTPGPEEISSADRELLALNSAPDQSTSVDGAGSGETDLEAGILAQLGQDSDNGSRASLKLPTSNRSAQLKRLPNGSYQHTVTFSGETPAKLADWYTGNPKLAAKLAGIDKRSAHAALRRGTKVTIPKSLMRNPLGLPEAALK